MTKRSRTYLKGISENGDTADQTLFTDLIDSAKNITDDAASNEAWSATVKFDKEYYPPIYTMTGNITYSIDATNANTGSGRVDLVIGDGNTITFTGFTIRESDLTPTSNVVTTVSGNIYKIVFLRRGSVSEVYLSDTGETVDETAPTITSATFANDESYIDLVFSEGVYGANDGSTPLALSDLDLTFAANGGTATDWTESSVKQNDNTSEGSASALVGGETTVRIFGSKTGTADGNETVTITPTDGSSIYDSEGNAMDAGQTTDATMNDDGDLVAPTVSSATVENADPDALVVVFDEAVTLTDMTGLSLNGDWTGVTISSLTSGDGTNTLTFALDTPIANGESGSFVYGATNNIEDTSGNGLVASSTVVTNNVASGYTFANTHELVVNASGEGVSILNSDCYPSNGAGADDAFSVEFWIETPSSFLSAKNMIVGRDNDDNSALLYAGSGTSGALRFVLQSDAGGSNKISRTAPVSSLSTTTLHHVVFTYDGTESSTGMNIYVDGSNVDNNDNNTGSYTGISALVGSYLTDIGNYIGTQQDGNYQIFRQYNAELTSGEVTTLYNSGTPAGLSASLQAKCVQENLFNNNANADNIGVNGTTEGTATYQTV